MNPSTDPLSQLRDIHLPDPISWWPLAPGWWLVALLFVTAVVGLIHLIRSRRRANSYRRVANKALQRNWQQLQSDDDKLHYLQALLELLRRCTLTLPQQARTSSKLTGNDWLSYLDRCTPPSSTNELRFCSPLGKLLLSEPYRQSPEVSDEQIKQLHDLCLSWITRHQAPQQEAGNA